MKQFLVGVFFLSQIAWAGVYAGRSVDPGHSYRDVISGATYVCTLHEAWETPKGPIPFARLDFSRVVDPYHDIYMLMIEALSKHRF